MIGTHVSRIGGWATVVVLMAASSFAVTEYTRDRYDVIIDRSPFGANPLSAAEVANNARQAASVVAAAQAAAKELRLCFLFETNEGEIRAGFENKTARAGDPKSVMLMVGESFKGMKLLKIDLENSQATLDRSGTQVTFELSKPAVGKVAPKKAVAPSQRRFGGGFQRKAPPPKKPAEPQMSPEEQARKREEVRENLRQYQMEVIRAGMPPLPIPLTQDMDDQLVAEGILPSG